MTEYGLPALYVAATWWFATGVIFYLDGLGAHTHPRTFLGATVLLVVGILGLAASRNMESAAGAYAAYTSALLIWAWIETSFLLGFVTGPRKIACATNASGGERFVQAVLAIAWHELATLGLVFVVTLLVWRAPNSVGLETFVALWVMRLSAKLNLFLGARNTGEEFLPAHLAYLASYFTRRPMNLLFPVSVTATTVAAFFAAQEAMAPGATPLATAGYTMLAALLSLAALEHWFLVLPIPSATLWGWSLRPEAARAQALPRK
jgi:putative photosynthetic complex assembly protein 2